MDPLILSRVQFAVTTCYHFLFVPLSIGVGLLLAIMETLYLRTNDKLYLRMTRYWAKFFLISVAMGVVTGIVLEFQFGLNWARFSRYVGDVFGPPLAIEAWAAFFLESVFIGIWLYGWNKLSPKLHLLCIWMVTLGAMLSAYWIITANGFMQEPSGYAVRNGRIELVDFFAVSFHPRALMLFFHAVFACITTSAFFVIGICALNFIRKTKEVEFFRRSLHLAAILGLVGILGVSGVGHRLGQRVAQKQPMKLAAMEAIWETQTDGSESLFAIIDEKGRRNTLDIKAPWVLNLLVFDKITGTIRGMKDLQKDFEAEFGPGKYIPPVTLTYWSFRIMVGSGMLMLFLLIYLVFCTTRRKFDFHPLFLWALVLAMVLPHAASLTGWIVTEVGRQPWVVQGLLLTRDGLTRNLDGSTALASLILFTLVYTVLSFIAVSLAVRFVKKGPEAAH